MIFEEGLSDSIISMLSEQYPLTAKELQEQNFFSSKPKYSKQAVHKALKKLEFRGIVCRVGTAYRLTDEYIENMERWLNSVKDNYYGGSTATFTVPKNGKREYLVTSLLQLDSLWNSIISEKILEQSRGEISYHQHVPHAWFALSHVEAEIRVTDLITKHCQSFYTLVNGNSSLDRWIGRFYRGKKSHYTSRSEPKVRFDNYQFAVLGTYTIEAKYPSELTKRLHSLFELSSNLSQLNLQELIRTVNAPFDINIIVQNKKGRAETLREQIMAHF